MKKSSFLLGVFVGTVVGGVSAILTTPKNGAEVRSDIKKESEKFYSDAKGKYVNLSEKVSEKYKEEMENIKKLYKENNEKYKEEITKLNERYFKKNNVSDLSVDTDLEAGHSEDVGNVEIIKEDKSESL